MTKELADKIIEIADHFGYDAKLYENYSGRGMFGRTTYGVVVDGRPEDVLSGCRDASEDFGEDSEQFESDNFRWDNMGLQMIIY